MFRGQFSHTVDPKGRLSIPADFREVLADGFGDKLMVAPNGNALDVYPERTWKALEDKVSELPLLDNLSPMVSSITLPTITVASSAVNSLMVFITS